MLSFDTKKLRKFLEDQPLTYWFKLQASQIIELIDAYEKLKEEHDKCSRKGE